MSGTFSPRRLEDIEAAFRSLPDRYLGAQPGFDATYHIRLRDVGHSWEVRATTHGTRVRKGLTRREPDVHLGTDAETWMRLRDGELSGLKASPDRLLNFLRTLALAVPFEGMFSLPNGRPPL